MDANNVVLLRGTISSEPVLRVLPSGDSVTQIEVTTQVSGRAASVPVAVHGRAVTVGEGDVVVITGHINRRFFRAGGVMQSRTEVIASQVVKATRKRSVVRLVEGVLDTIGIEDPTTG